MKKLVMLGVLLLLGSLPAFALENGQVIYVGGTAKELSSGTLGKFDMTGETELIFEHSGTRLTIAYADIRTYEYSSEVTHHLGVMPAIAVGLVKMRRHSHYFIISYRGQNDVTEAVVFEVPKQMPKTLEAVLRARAPQATLPSHAVKAYPLAKTQNASPPSVHP